MAAAKNPTKVIRVDSRMSVLCEAQNFHLTTTLVAHQKLATLSSNMPLLNGKIRVMGSKITEIGASGGRKGRKRRKKVPATTTARRTKRWALLAGETDRLGRGERGIYVPVFWAQV